MNDNIKTEPWAENVVLVDADYVDAVAFNLTVNFERMLGRRIPKADTARWIDCIALDGGLRAGDHKTQVVMVHAGENSRMENFTTGDYEAELNGKAFCDNLGEFLISSLPIEKEAGGDDLFMEALGAICSAEEVRRIMVVPNAETIYDRVRATLHNVDDEEKRVTVFAMQPMPGGNFRQEILGYSLMNALGISGDEIK